MFYKDNSGDIEIEGVLVLYFFIVLVLFLLVDMFMLIVIRIVGLFTVTNSLVIVVTNVYCLIGVAIVVAIHVLYMSLPVLNMSLCVISKYLLTK